MQVHRVIKAAVVAVTALAIAMICQAGQLDGTRCKVRIVPDKAAADKGEKEFGDKLSFTNGIFTSEYFLARGFKPTEYDGEAEPDEAEFAVDQTNETAGTLNWLGQIRDKHVVGKLNWTKKDGTTLSYAINGTKE